MPFAHPSILHTGLHEPPHQALLLLFGQNLPLEPGQLLACEPEKAMLLLCVFNELCLCQVLVVTMACGCCFAYSTLSITLMHT